MRRYLFALVLTGSLALTLPLFAQKAKLESALSHEANPALEALYAAHSISQIQLDANGIPTFLEGDLTPAQRAASPLEMAYGFFRENQALYHMTDPRTELRPVKTTVDEAGMTHITLEQNYRDVPIFQSQIKVHVSADQRLRTVNGTYLPRLMLDLVPALPATAAEAGAQRDMNVKYSDCTFRPTRLVIYHDDEITVLPLSFLEMSNTLFSLCVHVLASLPAQVR